MTAPQRILHLIDRLDAYGEARMLRYLAPQQVETAQRVCIAPLSADRRIVAELRDAGVEVRPLSRRWTIDPVALARLAGLRRKGRFDLLHVWNRAAQRYARLTDRAAVKVKNTAVIEGAVALGTGPTAPSFDRGELLRQIEANDDARLIVVAGPLVRRKQIDEAIWCFELVRVLHERARLIVIGDGPDRRRLERFAEAVSDPRCVHFLGERRDVRSLLPLADVVWQLGPASTPPHALLEASAAGSPIVASDVPACRAVIDPGVTGLLVPGVERVPLVRATDDLLNDQPRAAQLGAAAAASSAKQWSLDAALEQFSRRYAEAAFHEQARQ